MGTLRFQLFGFPVRIEPSYWFITLLFGWGIGRSSVALGLMVAAIIFVSILVHELGHALSARAFGLSPQISLHIMGGTTAFPPSAQLTRGRDVMISLAGPFAGFALGIVALMLMRLYGPAAGVMPEGYEPSLFIIGLEFLATVNLFWGAINLIPVIPLDGGRVMAAIMGPERRQLAAGISLAVGLGISFLFLQSGWVAAALILGLSAVTSFFRVRQASAPQASVNDESLKQALHAAQQALDNGAFAQAIMLARGVLGVATDPKVGGRALEILIWAHLGAGEVELAQQAARSAPEGVIDGYAAGAAHEAAGSLDDARRVLGRARALGDSRVELTALLVKVMLAQEDYPSAATLTREIVDKITPDDVRRVATEAEEGGAHAEAARLSLDLATTEPSFRDACKAVFGFAKAGANSDLVEAFKLARSFDRDATLKLLDDERLTAAKTELEGV